MPTVRRTRTIAMPVDELWQTIRDPHHLPRWWPRVTRVEDVTERAFTEVLRASGGKLVRADFELAECDELARRLRWEQRLEDSPFARLLKSAHTTVSLAAADRADSQTAVTIELSQTLAGFSARFGSLMVRKAAAATIEEALDGLERIGGPGG
jgi:carbon monoxide dehydrogenase subunit G